MGKRIQDLTIEERREAGRKGGIKSGEVRRAKRNMRENLDLLLNMTLKKGQLNDIEEIRSLAELKGLNIDVQTAILLAQVQKALKGSVMSAEFLRDTAGQRPEDIVNLNTEGEDMSLNININYGEQKSEDEVKKE